MAKILILPPEMIHSPLNLTVMQEVNPAAQGSENATQEQGYLMAYDKKEQKAKGVKGIAANGELETLEASERNKGQFVRVDRFGNFFTNFGKNFLYQYNNPTRFSLYRMEENTPGGTGRQENRGGPNAPRTRPSAASFPRTTASTTTISSTNGRSTGSRRSVTALPRRCSNRRAIWKSCCRAGSPA